MKLAEEHLTTQIGLHVLSSSIFASAGTKSSARSTSYMFSNPIWPNAPCLPLPVAEHTRLSRHKTSHGTDIIFHGTSQPSTAQPRLLRQKAPATKIAFRGTKPLKAHICLSWHISASHGNLIAFHGTILAFHSTSPPLMIQSAFYDTSASHDKYRLSRPTLAFPDTSSPSSCEKQINHCCPDSGKPQLQQWHLFSKYFQ